MMSVTRFRLTVRDCLANAREQVDALLASLRAEIAPGTITDDLRIVYDGVTCGSLQFDVGFGTFAARLNVRLLNPDGSAYCGWENLSTLLEPRIAEEIQDLAVAVLWKRGVSESAGSSCVWLVRYGSGEPRSFVAFSTERRAYERAVQALADRLGQSVPAALMPDRLAVVDETTATRELRAFFERHMAGHDLVVLPVALQE